MDALKLTFNGLTRYRGHIGHLSFILHRLTGLGTLLFLIVHILDTSTVYFFPSLYEHAIALYRSTPFIIGEIFLVFSVIYHGVNGLRQVLHDFVSDDRTMRKLTWMLFAFWVVISLIGAVAIVGGVRRSQSRSKPEPRKRLC